MTMSKRKNKKYLLILISFVLTTFISSCSTKLTENENFKILNLETLKASFKEEKQEINERILKDSQSTELSNEEIKLLNDSLADCITAYNASVYNDPDKIEFKNYKWFAIPLINSNGDKMIYIKAYKSDSSEKLDDFITIQLSKAKGNSYLSLLINLTYKRAGAIRLNGEAKSYKTSIQQ